MVSLENPEGASPADALTAAQWGWLGTSDFQNCMTMNLFCAKATKFVVIYHTIRDNSKRKRETHTWTLIKLFRIKDLFPGTKQKGTGSVPCRLAFSTSSSINHHQPNLAEKWLRQTQWLVFLASDKNLQTQVRRDFIHKEFSSKERGVIGKGRMLWP